MRSCNWRVSLRKGKKGGAASAALTDDNAANGNPGEKDAAVQPEGGRVAVSGGKNGNQLTSKWKRGIVYPKVHEKGE